MHLNCLSVKLRRDASRQLKPDSHLIGAGPFIVMLDAPFSDDAGPGGLFAVAELHPHAAECGTLAIPLDEEEYGRAQPVRKHVDERAARGIRTEAAPVDTSPRRGKAQTAIDADDGAGTLRSSRPVGEQKNTMGQVAVDQTGGAEGGHQ